MKAIKRWWPLSGIIAPFLYIIIDAYISTQYKGYSYLDQTVSELSAIGAPTAKLWQTLTLPFNPLLIMFGTGLVLTYKKASLRLVGILLIMWGFLGYVWLFFPMNQRGSIGGTSDSGHLILAGLTVLLMTSLVPVGSQALGRKFRKYSFITIALMLIFGVLTAFQAPKVATNTPTPYLGILERVSVFTPLVWLFVLASSILRLNKDIENTNSFAKNRR